MTLKEVIRRADEVRPNALSEERKAAWVWEVETEFALLRQEGSLPENPWPEDGELSIPFPDNRVYELYLRSRIDDANQETALYANDYVQYNAAWKEATARWRRGHDQYHGKRWEVGL